MTAADLKPPMKREISHIGGMYHSVAEMKIQPSLGQQQQRRFSASYSPAGSSGSPGGSHSFSSASASSSFSSSPFSPPSNEFFSNINSNSSIDIDIDIKSDRSQLPPLQYDSSPTASASDTDSDAQLSELSKHKPKIRSLWQSQSQSQHRPSAAAGGGGASQSQIPNQIPVKPRALRLRQSQSHQLQRGSFQSQSQRRSSSSSSSPSSSCQSSSYQSVTVPPRRARVGGYKRTELYHLLSKKSNYIICDNYVELPKVNEVYLCKDWMKLPGARASRPHEFRKGIRFSLGTYTQSQTVSEDVIWTVRQSRCLGLRLCDRCGHRFPRRAKLASKCSKPGCDGEMSSAGGCCVTVFYLFPSLSSDTPSQYDESDPRRIIVCIPDDLKPCAVHAAQCDA